MPFALQKLLCFMKFHLSVVDPETLATGILFRKSPIPVNLRLFPTFCYIEFTVSGFMLKSLNHLDFSFVQHDRYGFSCIF